MTSGNPHPIAIEPELLAQLERVLSEGEAVEAFVRAAVSGEIARRARVLEIYAHGEEAWQEFLRTGASYPADEVFDRLRACIEAKRRRLSSPLVVESASPKGSS